MSALSSLTKPASPSSSTEQLASCDSASRLQVFLGGSCNPTTWRQKLAIPYLTLNGISYYNPQVDDWTPKFVDVERIAKQNADILLFVIDRQTRSTVGLVESAFIAGEGGRNLVLVIYPFSYSARNFVDSSTQVTQTSTSKSSHTNSLNSTKSRSMLAATSTTSSKRLFARSLATSSEFACSSSTAETFSTKSLRAETFSAVSSTLPSSTDALDGASCKFDRKIGQESCLTHAKHALETFKINDENVSQHEFVELVQARWILKQLVAMKRIPIFSETLQALKFISNCLATSNRADQFKHPFRGHTLYKCMSSLRIKDDEESLNSLSFSVHQNETVQVKDESHSDDVLRDIYLTLDSDDPELIESTVVPILKEKGLSYDYVTGKTLIESNELMKDMDRPHPDSSIVHSTMDQSLGDPSHHYEDIGGASELALQKKLCSIQKSRIRLFVITNRCRGLSVMVLASHFMALSRNSVVLCVQYLDEACSVASETLTKTAIADYNRSRVYLCDYAVKSQVPVFSTIQEAVECCRLKCATNKQ